MADAELERDILAGRKIAAIKRYRLATGASLTTAKQVVEGIEERLRAAGHVPVRATLTRQQRRKLVFVFVLFAVSAVAIVALLGMAFLGSLNRH